MTKICITFNIAIAKKIITWTAGNIVFGYNKTDANLQRIIMHKNYNQIFVPRNSRNILVKPVSFYFERIQRYGVLKNVQLFGASLYKCAILYGYFAC